MKPCEVSNIVYLQKHETFGYLEIIVASSVSPVMCIVQSLVLFSLPTFQDTTSTMKTKLTQIFPSD